jgi:hypothetical protein
MNSTTKMQNPRPLLAFGMTCLVIAILLMRFVHPAGQAAQNLSHGIGGMFMGISIVMNLWSVIIGARQRRCAVN